MAAKREGQAQLSTWINTDSMARLKTLANDEGVSIRESLERAIAAYQPGIVTAPTTTPATGDDRLEQLAAMLADHEDRIAAMESRQCLDKQLDTGLDSIITRLDESSQQLDILIPELARQGMTPTAIADELNRLGHRTAEGKPFQRGHSKIRTAIKTLSSQKLDNGLDKSESDNDNLLI